MLYIMRHGKTDWNELKKLQGQTDIPLNEEGRGQATAAGREYAGIHLDICYCSTLGRARETARLFFEARALAKHKPGGSTAGDDGKNGEYEENIPIVYDERLREMGFGTYEGIERCFDIPDCPVNVFFKHPEEYDVPVEGGESMDELFARTGEFLKENVYPALKEGKDILIIGHGAMNSSIICQVKNNSDRTRFWEVGIPNCKMIQVSGDEAR